MIYRVLAPLQAGLKNSRVLLPAQIWRLEVFTIGKRFDSVYNSGSLLDLKNEQKQLSEFLPVQGSQKYIHMGTICI